MNLSRFGETLFMEVGVKRCLLLLLVVPGLAARARADEIDDYVKGEMKRLQIPALTYGIVRNGQLVRSEALGLSDPIAKTPARVGDLRSQSIT